jgi:signal transduction histidine kinase
MTKTLSAQETPDFHLLFESAPNLNLVLSPDLKIVAVTDAYLRATMTRREDILNRHIFEVFPDNPDDPAATGVDNLRTSLNRVLKERVPDTMAVQRYDIRKPESEGGEFEERFWSPVNSPTFGPDGELTYIVHRVEDVTQFVRDIVQEQNLKRNATAERVDLKGRVAQMEAEVYLRAKEVQESNHRLELANKELESFSYSVSHDLRAPLRGIDGFSLAMLEDYGPLLDATGRDYLERIRAATKRMGLLIDDLLALARIARGELIKEATDLSRIAGNVADELIKASPERKVDVAIAANITAEADPRLLRIAFENLLGNAWKFTSK